MAIRVQVPVTVDLDDGQQQSYAARHGLAADGRQLRAKDFVDSIQAAALVALQQSADLQDTVVALKR